MSAQALKSASVYPRGTGQFFFFGGGRLSGYRIADAVQRYFFDKGVGSFCDYCGGLMVGSVDEGDRSAIAMVNQDGVVSGAVATAPEVFPRLPGADILCCGFEGKEPCARIGHKPLH